MNQKSIIAILGVVVVILIGTTLYFATINKATPPVSKVVQQPVPAPTPTVQQPSQPATPTAQPADETASWQTYSNTQYGFEIKYPKGYEIIQDKSGWPHSIVLISRKNVSAYDLPIEIWKNKAEIQGEIDKGNRSSYDLNYMVTKTTSDGKLITFTNISEEKEVVNKIISTFKFTK